jgi:glutathione S-transferase
MWDTLQPKDKRPAMKLFYSPGACSLASHIVLRESKLPFELVKVNLKEKVTADGRNFLSINPKGYVPALELDDGEVLTEGATILAYLGDHAPNGDLAPAQGTKQRRRLAEWLHFIATELQKGISPLNNPKGTEELKQALRQRLDLRFGYLAKSLTAQPYILGEQYSVADAYAYYVLRSLRRLDAAALEASQPLSSYFARIHAREATQAALTAEGIT